MSKFFGVVAVSLALCAGCSDGSTTEETTNLQQKGGLWVPNGPDIVHGNLHGRFIQGVRLSRGRPVTLVDADGSNLYNTEAYYKGFPVETMPMNQGWFRFTYHNGVVAEKLAAAGLSFNFMGLDPSGSALVPHTMFVKAVDKADTGAAEYGQHWIYYSYTTTAGTPGETKSLCVDHDGNDEPAVPVFQRYWDMKNGNAVVAENVIHLACKSAAVAGCMDYGYVPWQSHTECTPAGGCHPANMWNIHQVCTRLKRADYCGTGTAHTMSGVMIHPFDWLSPPINDSGSMYFKSLEAVWGVNGVSCVNVANLRHEELVDQDPACHDQLYLATPACNPERLGQDILGDLVDKF